jgi:hypothetical protein
VADPYIPALETFVWSDDEEEAIRVALLHAEPWDHDASELRQVRTKLREIKGRILEFHLARQGHTCCYCRTNLNGGGYFLVDREHVLPKSKFKSLTYTISNLSVSCKRCNLQFKGNDLGFLRDSLSVENNHDDSEQYLFAHPNFDNLDALIERVSVQISRKVAVAFRVSDHPKAHFTYDYFDLRGLEVSSFDDVQGGRKLDELELEISKLLSIEVASVRHDDGESP